MSDESTPKTVSDETKEKFRQEHGENSIPAAGGESAIHGVHGKAGNKRQFRRKSS